MEMHRIPYFFFYLRLFVFCPGIFLITIYSFSQTKQTLDKSKKQLEEEIRTTSKLLDETKKDKQTSLKTLQILTRQIEQREGLLQTINQEIKGIDRQILSDTRLIESKSRELKALRDEYARIIYHAYMNMNMYTRMMFVFSAKDFNQAYRRLKYYQQYASYRRTQAERIRTIQEDLNSKRRALIQVKDQKITLAKREEQEKSSLTKEKLQKDNAIRELSKKEKQLLASLQQKQQALRKLQAEIERVIAEEARARLVNKEKTSVGTSAADLRLSSSFAANKGRLPWPADQGVITATFGEHPHPVLKYVKVNNQGIDITGGRNTDVKAVFNGSVSRICAIPNLNKVVMIRHGDYLTVYANLDEVTVSDGLAVTTGQVIGKAHYDEVEGKSEFNFQVWHGKTIENPQQWLRR